MSSVDTITVHGVPVFGQGVAPTVGAPQDTSGNSLVTVLSWTAEYNAGQLQVNAVLQPVDPAGIIMSLVSAATPPNQPSKVLCGSDGVLFGGDAPGMSVASMAFTALWDPDTYGTEVVASINGLIYSDGRTHGYGWSQTMTVTGA
jgi:hypothetical protein